MDNKLERLGVFEQGGRAVVSSRDIARVFGKKHGHVMRGIRQIIKNDPKWGASNFGQMSYRDCMDRNQTEYAVTRDGFTLLVMGYTGEKAMGFKKDYIAAFNEMEAKLKQPASIEGLLKSPELLLALVKRHVEAVEENERLQLTAAKYEAQTDTVGLYKIGDIAADFGISAVRLNGFLKNCRVQYKPNGSDTWRLYTQYSGDNLAFTRLVPLDTGFDVPVLMWTPKGRDFIFDLVEKETPPWYA